MKDKTKNNFRLIWSFLDGSRLLFVLSVAAAGISSLMEMLGPQIIRAALDNALGGKPSEFPAWVNSRVEALGGFEYLAEHLYLMAIALMAVAAVNVLCQYANRVWNTMASETLVKTMRDRLFSHIQALPFAWHMNNQTGDIIQRCTSDVDMVRRFIAEQLTTVCRIVIMLGLSLYFMFSMDLRLSLIALAPIPVILIYSVKFRGEMSKKFAVCDENEGIVSSTVQENLTGVRVVRAFARERRELDSFLAKNNYYASLWVDMGRVMAGFFSVQDMLTSLQLLMVVVFGCKFCVEGSLTGGEYVAFLSYNSMLSFPMRRLGRVISEMSKAGVSIERIAYIMNSEEERDRPGCIDADMNGDIRFEHVDFAYEGAPLLLKDINLEIKAGSTLGILGGTGSGKSTLMLLLDKLYEIPEGCGCISIGGVDIRDIRTEHLRKNIAMVLQEPFMFSRSIEANIGIGVPGISLEEVRAAAAAACLDDTVMDFSRGYDTFVGERGVTLSGGQKQRAAIARALTVNAPIMIFDDSLSAVDTETDAKIRAALEERFASATVILISHRITTLAKADKIIVMNNGRIEEQGSHQELCSAGGLYQRIYDIQSGNREAENE